ncbi:MAG: hypothetical protein DRJ56_04910 [Thermoprotei archaeon]|nr:MAG: hypothetical protein DRJ56_04910 [Thermoprotei archaeon]
MEASAPKLETMPRRSLADALLAEAASEADDGPEGGAYLVLYDFRMGVRRSIPTKFYENLSRIMRRGRCRFVQKSVVLCEDLTTAYAVARLARYYGAEVAVYKARPLEWRPGP